MKEPYPTLEQVEAADQEQLCRWYRYLPSPGCSALSSVAEFEAARDREKPVLDRICERWQAGGGFTPEISKRIG